MTSSGVDCLDAFSMGPPCQTATSSSSPAVWSQRPRTYGFTFSDLRQRFVPQLVLVARRRTSPSTAPSPSRSWKSVEPTQAIRLNPRMTGRRAERPEMLGDDVQHLVVWYHVLRALNPDENIIQLAVEAKERATSTTLSCTALRVHRSTGRSRHPSTPLARQDPLGSWGTRRAKPVCSSASIRAG